MKRAIIFGGSGFIGSAIVKALLKHDMEVCAVVKPGFEHSPERFRLDGLNVPIAECDLRNTANLKEIIPWETADVFYQLAWDGLDGAKIEDYALQLQNVKWTLDSIAAAASLGCKKFIGAGTISQDELKLPEEKQQHADRHRFFRCAAWTCEYMGMSAAAEYGIDFIWPVISNVYGEGEVNPRLITTLIRSLLNDETMPLSAGTQKYDFIYASDAGEAYYLLGKYGRANRRYNVSGGNARPLKEYLQQIHKIVAPNVRLGLGDRHDAAVSLTDDSFDISTLREDTGFEPRISFAAGIKRTSDWIKKQNGNL